MKTKELMKKLEEGMTEVFNSERYKDWLEVQKNFRNYSYANTMLILLQRPKARQVAGYKTWQKLGRQVNKGEKGIKIFAPNIRKVEKKDQETGEKVQKKEIKGFFPVSLFDISQTSGEELPEIAQELEGDSDIAEYIYEKAKTIAEKDNLKVELYTEDERSSKGCYEPYNKIGIKEASKDQQAKTIIHELTHHKTHEQVESYQEGEIIAESVAYIVCSSYGLDTSEYSFEYVAAWASNKQNTEPLKKVAGLIQKTADSIIKELEAQDEKAALAV